MVRTIGALFCGLGLIGSIAAAPARAEAAATADADDASEASLTEINKKLTNPVSDIWSLTFQDNNYRIDPGPGQDDRWSTNLLFQPVLPVGLTPDVNLITRPVIPLFVSQPHPERSDPSDFERTTAFGDITLLQLLSPSPKVVGNWLLGAGPSWIFPTAGSDFTGQGKYQVGPGALVGYLADKWILGALFQNWWSYGGSGPSRTNSMNLQPVASYFLEDGWSVGYSGNILADWKGSGGNVYTVPIGLAVAKVQRFGPLPVRISLGVQYMPIHPDRFGQKMNFQLIVAPVIPKLVKRNLISD